MPETPLISVAIPCYEMGGRGAEHLGIALATCARQDYARVEIVVADHSVDDTLERLCDEWSGDLAIRYIRNHRRRGSSSANANVAMAACRGAIIKVLCQDDYLAHDGALTATAAALDSSAMWLVGSYFHTRDRRDLLDIHRPRLNRRIELHNSIGTHSCLALRNTTDLETFDEDLIWMMDCEYYRRLADRYGLPVILHEPSVVQLLWEGQVTHTLVTEGIKVREQDLVRAKHPAPIPGLPA